MSLSYRANGRWYVLREMGDGQLRGADTSFGAGTVNYTTQTVSVTLGALPDVGSSLIYNWVEDSTPSTTNLELRYGGKAYFAFNTSGQEGTAKGAKAISPGTLTLSWENGGTQTATDNGAGVISGAATGTVDYQNGVVVLHPNSLPPEGTVVSATQQTHLAGIALASFTDVVDVPTAAFNLSLPAGVTPGTVAFSLQAYLYATTSGTAALDNPVLGPNEVVGYDSGTLRPLSSGASRFTVSFTDDGAGNIKALVAGASTAAGVINYATGAVTVSLSPANFVGATLTRTVQKLAYTLLGASYISATRLVTGVLTSTATGVKFVLRNTTAGGLPVTYSSSPAVADPISATLNTLFVSPLTVADGFTVQSVAFALGSTGYRSNPAGGLWSAFSSTTGVGTPAGTLTATTGELAITSWPDGAAPVVAGFRAVQAAPAVGTQALNSNCALIFRAASAPLRPGSVQLNFTMSDGQLVSVSADTNGVINHSRVVGFVNHEQGVVTVVFTNPATTYLGTADLTAMALPGVTLVNLDTADMAGFRYNAVAYSYLPLDAELLGLDPVRLPSDGRVPIFRPGGFAVVGHTGSISATVSNGQTIDCARVRLSRVRVIGADGLVINTGYSADLEAGTVSFDNVSGYSQPITVQHRIEDMGLVGDVQISGEITFTRALTHAYPLGSHVSSALVVGDMFARTHTVFDQATWDGTWKDVITGSAATGTYNATAYPIAVSNRGAITERWTIQFTNTTSFNVIGEHVGVVATGNTGANCAPLNPGTGAAYFTLPAVGWGSGWATGNVLRFNTQGAMYPVWVVRTVAQGPETVTDDTFTLLIRGDVDTP